MDESKNAGEFAEVVIPGSDVGESSGGFKIPPAGSSRYAGKGAYSGENYRRSEGDLCLSYDSGMAFIGRVQIYSWGAKRSFYERFRSDALRYRDMKGEAAEHVPFFSYIPQYSQMNLYQSRFYLYFRDLARRGEYVPADLSYILLYIYELINLSDRSDAAEDINILCGVWMAYRDTYPALDKYMAEWVCDYCLLYRLDVPECTLSILPKMCESASLREFYMSAAARDGGIMKGEVLESLADYDRKKSRVQLPSELALHFPKALEAACSAFGEDHFIAKQSSVITRDAFCGSLCAHNVKRRIVVEYYPALRRSGVRHMLGAAVKYTENKLRRAAGIKSRLHTDGLPDPVKARIDSYFDNAMPGVFSKKTEKAEQIPEYEKFYDAADIPFTADAAEKIELESRAAAEMLSSDVDLVPEDLPATVELRFAENNAEAVVGSGKDEKESVKKSERIIADALRCMLEGEELESYCRERGILPDSAAGDINEAAVDFFGDVLLERDGGKWQLIPDYLEQAAEMVVMYGDEA